MRLNKIHARAFQGARDVEINIDKPVLIVAGDNESGKTSTFEAVNLALLGEPSFPIAKKHYGNLVTDGSKLGQVLVRTSHGDATFELPSGKWGEDLSVKLAALRYCLNPPKLMELSNLELRQFLFNLMGATMSSEEVAKRLRTRAEITESVVTAVLPVLKDKEKGGFEAASKYAADRARETKGSWCEVTGEKSWGSQKGEIWKIEAPTYDHDRVARVEAKLNSIKTELAEARTEHGRLTGMRETEERHETNLIALRASLDRLPALQSDVSRLEDEYSFQRDDLAKATAELNQVAAEIQAITSARATPTAAKRTAAQQSGDPGELLAAGAEVIRQFIDLTNETDGYFKSNVRTLWDNVPFIEQAIEFRLAFNRQFPDHGTPVVEAELEPEPVVSHEEVPAAKHAARQAAARKVEQLDTKLKQTEESLRKARDKLAEAKGANALIEQLEASAPPPVSHEVLGKAAAAVDSLAADETALKAELDGLREAVKAQTAAIEKTRRARQHHESIIAWDACSKALLPDGIQAEILSETLSPLNELLRKIATDSGWPQVTIDVADLTIRYGQRSYHELAKTGSAKWRCDAMLAAMVAAQSGIKFVMLDCIDINSIPNRLKLLRWIYTALQSGYLEGAVLYGTLKEPPKVPAAAFQTVWLEGGRNVDFQQPQAKAA
jgi:hypothetical protein